MFDEIRAIVLMSMEEAIGKSVAEIWRDYQGDDDAASVRLRETIARGRALLALAERELDDREPETVISTVPSPDFGSLLRGVRAATDRLVNYDPKKMEKEMLAGALRNIREVDPAFCDLLEKSLLNE